MCKIGKFIGCCLIAASLLACTACSGLDKLSENLKDGAEQLSDDVVIGKSNALITPYQSFEGSRTADNEAFLATYDASVTGFNGQDILVADTDLKENECREIMIQYQFSSLNGDCQLIYISPDLEEQVLSESASGSVAVQLQAGANYIGIIGTDYSGAIQIMTVALAVWGTKHCWPNGRLRPSPKLKKSSSAPSWAKPVWRLSCRGCAQRFPLPCAFWLRTA